ncbi:MAG TPA: hemolysin III family protein [Bacillota bacterium]|nr:hemolysin III family protein [Bacillota bacterium]
MRLQSFKDPLSGLSHFIGIILSIAGLILLVTKVSIGKPWHLFAFSIFGASMILLYTASTLYHWLPLSPKGTAFLRKLDHSMIFLLIAGTYTPICLIPLRGAWGWSLFGAIWGLALFGIGYKSIWFTAPRWLSTAIYIVMGWLVIIAIWPLVHIVPWPGLAWLLTGGLFYTTGAVIYGIKKPNPWPEVFGFHEIFHLFVLMGTISHFWMVYRYFVGIR